IGQLSNEKVFSIMWIVSVLSLFLLLAFLLLFFKTRYWYNPAGIIILFISLMLIVANFSITGIFVPTITTQLIFLLFMSGILFGGLLAFPSNFTQYEIVKENQGKILCLLILLCTPLIGIIVFKALTIIRAEGYLIYIFKTRGSEGGETLLFGDGYFRMVINYLIIPIIYAGVFIGVALFFVRNQKRIFLISALLLSMYTFVMSARDGFLLIFLVLGYTYLLVKREGKIKNYSSSVQYFLKGILLLVLAFVIYITAFRSKSS